MPFSTRRDLFRRSIALLAGLLVASGSHTARADEDNAATEVPKTVDTTERDLAFARYMTGAKLIGRFTVDSKPEMMPKEEEYTISKCEKLAESDRFRFTARIKYGETDSEVPMELRVLFAGDTPVITLDNVWIPGMGTFSSRVLIRNGRYVGTWQHDDKGGHMFGRIEKSKEADTP